MLVLVVIAAIMMVLGSFSVTSNQDYRLTSKVNDSARAYHMAMTGLQTALYNINVDWDNRAVIEPNGFIPTTSSSAPSKDKLYFFTDDTEMEIDNVEYRVVSAFGVANDQVVKLQARFVLQQKGPPPESFAIINYFKYRDMFEDVGYTHPDDGPGTGLGNGVMDWYDKGFISSSGTVVGADNGYLDFEDDGYTGVDGLGNPVYSTDLADNGIYDFAAGERGELGEPLFVLPSKLKTLYTSNLDIKSMKYEEPVFTVLDRWKVFGSIYSNSSVAFDTEATETNSSVSLLLGPEDYNDNLIKDGFYTLPEIYTDFNGNGQFDVGEPFKDLIKNNIWDSGEPYTPTIAVTEEGVYYDNHVYDYGFITQDNGWVFNSDPDSDGHLPDDGLDQILDSLVQVKRDAVSKTSSNRASLESETGAYRRNYKDGFANRTKYYREHQNGSEEKDVKVEPSTPTFNAPYLLPPNLSNDDFLTPPNNTERNPVFPFRLKNVAGEMVYDQETALNKGDYDVYIGSSGVSVLADPANPEISAINNYPWRNPPVGSDTFDENTTYIDIRNVWDRSTFENAGSESANLSQTTLGNQWLMQIKRDNPYLIFATGNLSNRDDGLRTGTRFKRPTFLLEDFTTYANKNEDMVWTLGYSSVIASDGTRKPINGDNNSASDFPVAYTSSSYGGMFDMEIDLDDGLTDPVKFWVMQGRYFVKLNTVGDMTFAKPEGSSLSFWKEPVINGNNLSLAGSFDGGEQQWRTKIKHVDSENGELIEDIWIHPELNRKIIYIDGNFVIGQTWAREFRFITDEPYHDYNKNGLRDSDFDALGNPTIPEPFLDLNNNGIWDNGLTGANQGPAFGSVQLTFVVRGNIMVADDVWYGDTYWLGEEENVFSSQDVITYIALHHPDDDVYLDRDPDLNFDQIYKPTEDILIADLNGTGFAPEYGSAYPSPPAPNRGAGEGSGNIYLGHPSVGTLTSIHGRFYADNFFYANDKRTSKYKDLRVFGTFMAGGAVVFTAGEDTKNLIVYHDGRHWPFQERIDLGAKFPDDLGWQLYPGTFKREKVSDSEMQSVKDKVNALTGDIP